MAIIFGIVLAGLLGLGVIFFSVLGLMAMENKSQKKAAPTKFAETFNKVDDTAMYDWNSLTGPSKQDIIRAASARGYHFTGSTDSDHQATLLFQRTGS